MGTWSNLKSGAGWGSKATTMSRELHYSHPVKTKFPGMPSHAKTFKTQEYRYDGKGVLNLAEDLRFEGIPKADHFEGMP